MRPGSEIININGSAELLDEWLMNFSIWLSMLAFSRNGLEGTPNTTCVNRMTTRSDGTAMASSTHKNFNTLSNRHHEQGLLHISNKGYIVEPESEEDV